MKNIAIILMSLYASFNIYGQNRDYDSSIEIFLEPYQNTYGIVKFTPTIEGRVNALRILTLEKTDGITDTIWIPSVKSFNKGIGIIRGFYITDQYCSFTFASDMGREMVICKKNGLDKWEEVLRKFFIRDSEKLKNIKNVTLIGSHTVKVKYKADIFKESMYYFDVENDEIILFENEQKIQIPLNDWQDKLKK